MRKICRICFIVLLTIIFPFATNISADDGIIYDDGNVEYDGITPMLDRQTGTMRLLTTIMEYTLTFPTETTLLDYSTNFKKLGAVTVKGESFIKPYGVAVKISKKDFTLTSKKKVKKVKNRSNKIEFDVTRVKKDQKGKFINGGNFFDDTIHYSVQDASDNLNAPSDNNDNLTSNLDQSVDVGISINDSQWKKALPGNYKGSITFSAELDRGNVYELS